VKPVATFLCVLLAVAAGHAQADAKAGKEKSRSCATCHGALGVSTLPNAPNLAGQPEIYLSEQLKAYRAGKRNHEVMSVIAKPLSDDDIGDLSAWYASLKLEVKEQ
jgi:cytochrome c553